MYVYMHTYLQGDLKQIQEIQPTAMDIFPVVNQKKHPTFWGEMKLDMLHMPDSNGTMFLYVLNGPQSWAVSDLVI